MPASNERIEISRAAATLSSLQSARKDAKDGTGDMKRHLVEMLSQEDIEERVMQKGVRIVYVGKEYSNINYLIRHRARNERVHHFPSNQISRQYTSHELDRIPREAFNLPQAAVVDELLHNYFKFVNPGFPVVDEEVFMSQYRNQDPLNPPSLLVLQAVLMVGVHVSYSRPDRDILKVAFFRRAKMLFDARFEWNRDVVVQAALLLMWHSEGVEDIGANSYYWVGVAARTALGLGMHRDTGPSTLVSHDKRLWRRLWWTLVQMDVIVSLSYGRPPAIRLEDCDVPDISQADFAHVGECTDSDFFIYQTKLCSIIAQALKDRFGLRTSPEQRYQALIDADQHLATWMTELPSSLRPDHNTSCSPWVHTLHITYNNFLILLHRPPPKTHTITGVGNQDDMELCSTAASAIVNLLEGVRMRHELRYLNAFVVDAVFTTLIQLSAEMRVTNPILAVNAMRKFDMAMDSLRLLAEYWPNAEIINRLFEDSSERIRHELVIGKSVGRRGRDIALERAPAGIHLLGGAEAEDVHTDSWQTLMLDTTTVDRHLAGDNNQQLDWSNMYWENSGFVSLSPFADMSMYPTS